MKNIIKILILLTITLSVVACSNMEKNSNNSQDKLYDNFDSRSVGYIKM